MIAEAEKEKFDKSTGKVLLFKGSFVKLKDFLFRWKTS